MVFNSKAIFQACQPALTLCSTLGGVLLMDNAPVKQDRAAMAAAGATEVVA